MDNCFSNDCLLTNLILGLCKGSIRLAPYSQTFSKELGYELFRLELSFIYGNNGGGRIAPDSILVSNKLGNTLLLEWTMEDEVSDHKKNQLNRYARVTKTDLSTTAAIPPKAVSTFDFAVICQTKGIEKYKEFFLQQAISFPLIEFFSDDEIVTLTKHHNEIKEQQTNDFFENGIEVQSKLIPSYLKFSLNNISPKTLVPSVVRHLASLLMKGIGEVTIEKFCEGYIAIWWQIDSKKQSQIKSETKNLLTNLQGRSLGQSLLKRIGDNPPKWELLSPNFKKSPRNYHGRLEEFISEIQGRPFQYELDFPSPE